MNSLRLHIARFISLLVALQILNLGLFAQDFQPLVVSSISPETNIINSVDEYVTEVVLHHKDAVPENNKHPHKAIQAHKHTAFKLISFPKPQCITANQLGYNYKPTSITLDYNYQYCKDINPPPPKF